MNQNEDDVNTTVHRRNERGVNAVGRNTNVPSVNNSSNIRGKENVPSTLLTSNALPRRNDANRGRQSGVPPVRNARRPSPEHGTNVNQLFRDGGNDEADTGRSGARRAVSSNRTKRDRSDLRNVSLHSIYLLSFFA